tara:strand:- start:276 stop:527 length:252 start_codon:yes stop_codon:yes gene_type:complete
MKDFDRFIEEAALKRCPPGKYYDGKKCSVPPRGYHVGRGGYIEPDEDTKNGQNGKSSNGTANGSSNGNGGGGNGSNGGNGGGE